jgi:hypothetical protein
MQEASRGRGCNAVPTGGGPGGRRVLWGVEVRRRKARTHGFVAPAVAGYALVGRSYGW